MSQQIHLNDILLLNRGRTQYEGIEQLAEDILATGLIEPLVLTKTTPEDFPDLDSSCDGPVPEHKLVAGGRRLTALRLLHTQKLIEPYVFHGTTCEPQRPGYILNGELTPFKQLLVEIAENQNRHNLPWQDELALIVRAYWVAFNKRMADGKDTLMRNIGHMLGVGYHNLQAALVVHDEVKRDPERFKTCSNIRAAYAQLLSEQSNAIAKLANEAKGGEPSAQPAVATTTAGTEKGPDEVQSLVRPTIPLTSRFLLTDGINFLDQCKRNGVQFDHIITDPDYAVAVEQLESNSDAQAKGVAQESVDDSLADLESFLELSFSCVRPGGFLIFWYDLDHHEKLQAWAKSAGWLVQRWPITWHVIDRRSNASPSTNFPKNEEWAMVCRKPSACLQKVQMTSVISLPIGNTTKQFGHPFAKPEALWSFLYSAVTIPGQQVLDPFMGSGSAPCSAAAFGLEPFGCEVKEDHFANAMVNLRRTYEKLNPNSLFE